MCRQPRSRIPALAVESPAMTRTYIGVVVCEIIVIVALWAFSRAFA